MGSHALHRQQRLPEWADGYAIELAARPFATLAKLLALNLVFAACCAAAGLALLDDQAYLFRELAPATWLSFAQLLLIAVAAGAVHRRVAARLPWHRSFWGLAAVVFAVFAFDEITQSAIFLADLLEHGLGLAPAAGFHDIEAVLLTLLFMAAALVLLPRALVLLRHPWALALLAVAVALGAASQTLDSVAPPTRWEFVTEETLKLSAEAFFLGGFLTALRDVLARGESASRPDAPAAAVRRAAGPAATRPRPARRR
jgi:hypothetical protein